MGLLSNLRVLCASDIGDVVRDTRKKVAQLEADIDEMRELSELRFRRLRKRQSDERGVENGDARTVPENPALARLLARRSARAGARGGST
jgi:hypothetical protein